MNCYSSNFFLIQAKARLAIVDTAKRLTVWEIFHRIIKSKKKRKKKTQHNKTQHKSVGNFSNT